MQTQRRTTYAPANDIQGVRSIYRSSETGRRTLDQKELQGHRVSIRYLYVWVAEGDRPGGDIAALNRSHDVSSADGSSVLGENEGVGRHQVAVQGECAIYRHGLAQGHAGSIFNV